ncbi:MAG TPA: mycofactocin biosynthesis glycosyltransferase MftF [Nocardioides sp.]|nr:mycofactocin biosynthesis glycosyltransferase MftF [Nocardioides sp.]
MTTLPDGFRVRVRDDVRRLPSADGAVLLVGGSPLRALRLAAPAAALLRSETVAVADRSSEVVVRRLLDGNLADPAGLEPAPAAELTVVVPVKDRSAELDRCLAALAGLPVVVVDDGSQEPAAVAGVARRHGARLVALPVNRGPAAARNAGLACVETPFVAFVDSDVDVSPVVLLGLAGHFADPRVALAGPHVRGRSRSERPPWFERYDEQASSLALGSRACSVAPGAAVGWLPSACLVGRTAVLRDPSVDGFAETLRVGEDVDLVWRLVAAGHVVRYDPAHEAFHDARGTVRGWLGRKLVYGSGGAELGRRHGDAIAPAILSPAMALAAAAVLLRRRWSPFVAVGAVVWGGRTVAEALPAAPGRRRTAARLAVRGLGWGVRQESALLLRHWWPGVAVSALGSRGVRRAVGTALVIDSAVAIGQQPQANPAVTLLGRRLDDLAYGAGLWLGALRRRDAQCLRPVLVRRGRSRRRAG